MVIQLIDEIACDTIRTAFNTDGFFIARNLIHPTEIDICRADIGNVFVQQLKMLGLPVASDIFTNAQKLHSANIEQFKKVLGALWRLQSIGGLMNARPIQQFLKQTLDFGTVFAPGGQTVHVQSAELKIPNGYFGLRPHQDWPSVQGSMDGVGVWIPLCDIDQNGYPLEVIPGSHRLGLRDPANNDTDHPWVIDTCADTEFKPLCVCPGDVVFFSNFLIHRSGLSGRRNFVRLACSSRFDNGNEATFVSRGLPSAYTRGVNRRLMDFPDTAAVNLALELRQASNEPEK